MKEEILDELDKLKSIDITTKERDRLISDIKAYVRSSREPEPMFTNKKTIDIQYLQKKLTDAHFEGRIDGHVITLINRIIFDWEQLNG